MHLDVLDLRAFYYRTRLGRSAQRVLQEALVGLWPDTHGLAVVGYGFAAPLLRPFLARRAAGDGADAEPAGGDALAGGRPERERRWSRRRAGRSPPAPSTG